ncbi:hypothetical protein OAF65_03940 [Verrucomicrobiales bacterium]|nr:hypothetical protein [Verrucomicrobiales bacterium]
MKTLLFGAVLIGLTCLQALGARVGIYSIGDPQNNKTLSRILLQTGDDTLFGAEFIISHDPALEVESVECPDSAFVSNTNVPGQIQIALANASGITGDQIVVQIEFKKVIDSPDISLPSISLNEGEIVSIGSPDNTVFDKDDDGLLDADELEYFNTDPELKDTDGDSFGDGFEVTNSANPNEVTSFPTRAVIIEEPANGSVTGEGNYRLEDSAIIEAVPDAGFLFDSWSGDINGNENPLTIKMNSDLSIKALFIEDQRDPDSDGLNNHKEIVVYNTNPDIADSDGDGLLDGEEVNLTSTNPTAADSDDNGVVDSEDDQDGDGLSNIAEIKIHKTNPLLVDSDGDNFSDSEELKYELDPNVATNTSDIISRFRAFEESYQTLLAERDARPTQEAYDAVVAERDIKIEDVNELESLVTAKDATIAELEKRPTAEQLAAVEAERDARPTQEAYDAVVADRDGRPTTEQLQDARNGSIVVNGQNGEANISFNIEESEDLKTWQKTGEKITKTIQLKEGKKFYRFALDK